jgi:P27 family predicted phage terminase small subunit
MKTSGPPPQPTNLKILRGNPGKRKLSSTEPDPPPSIPSCPKYLNKVARVEWKRMAKELLSLGLISQLDRAFLAGYCTAYATWADAEEQLEQYGKVFKAPSGYPMASPYLAIRDRALEQMRAFGTEFGMSPSSRSRVKVKNPRQRSLFDDFLDGEEETG